MSCLVQVNAGTPWAPHNIVFSILIYPLPIKHVTCGNTFNLQWNATTVPLICKDLTIHVITCELLCTISVIDCRCWIFLETSLRKMTWHIPRFCGLLCGITDSSTINPKSKQYVLKSDKLYIAFTQLSGSNVVHLLNTYDIDRGMRTELHHKALQTICAATQANRHAISAWDIPLRSLSN